uniref:Exodeoxyribonuclease 7 large subunit n=1 Tax=Lygus hesperus TaxID=30085 RepID=A0A0A9YLK2_LYGHE
MKMLGFLKRNTRYFSNPAALGFTSLVRPLFEFSNVVWIPIYCNSRDALERVQQRFLRNVEFKMGHRWEDFNYKVSQQENHLASLESRQRMADASFLDGLTSGRIDS